MRAQVFLLIKTICNGVVKFLLPIPEIRNFKAQITERLIHHYIKKELSQKLIQEGHDLVFSIRTPFLPWGDPSIHVMAGMNPKEIEWEQVYSHYTMGDKIIIKDGKWLVNDKEKKKYVTQFIKDVKYEADTVLRNKLLEFYLDKKIFPDMDLIWDTIYLHSILYVATDGLLFKLKKTGRLFNKEKLLDKNISKEIYEMLPMKIPVYSGEIEVIEVKSDKGTIASNQVESYSLVIQGGFKIRYFHIFINSIIKNDFDIEETIIANENEIEPLIKKYRKLAQVRMVQSDEK